MTTSSPSTAARQGSPRDLRRWLDWRQSALPQVVDYLATFLADGQLDLSQWIVVLPGARAARRLGELLVLRSAEHGWLYRPPEIVTVGRLPEYLYVAERPLAGRLTTQLAWVRALQECPPELFESLHKRRPSAHDTREWMALAELVQTWHEELAAQRKNFRDVFRRLPDSAGPHERARWLALDTCERSYFRALESIGLWDKQSARRLAVDKEQCRTDRRILLVATADLDLLLRAMIDQVAANATALVFGDESRADWFDEIGCLVPERWHAAELTVADEQIRVGYRPHDQAEIVGEQIRMLAPTYEAEEITIGVPDATVAELIEYRLARGGVAVRRGGGESAESSRPALMIRAIADWFEDSRFDRFIRLVRQPDVFEWLARRLKRTDLLASLDHARATELALLLPPDGSGVMHRSAAGRMYRAVCRWLAPLTGPPRTLAAWAAGWRTVLARPFGVRHWRKEDPADGRVIAALHSIGQVLDEMDGTPVEWTTALSTVESATVILQRLAQDSWPDLMPGPAVDLVGWLDIALDDAPVAIITNFNEHYIPASTSASSFVPDSMRGELGMLDSYRRYARDAYWLATMAYSKAELVLVCGRRDAEDNPLVPSRLLLTGSPDRVAERLLWILNNCESHSLVPPDQAARRATNQQLVIPRPQPLAKAFTHLSVSDFAAYLRCPYRFYLSRALRLQPVPPDIGELDAAQFGKVLHAVLDQFAQLPVADSADAVLIETALDELLDRLVAETLSTSPFPALEIQIEHARLRLRAFARHQARRRAEGWRIASSEQRLTLVVPVDGVSIELRGRIDRIDWHEESGQVAVLDYKTGDGGRDPDQTHRYKGEWIDLQLPLYRWLIRSWTPPAPIDADAMVLGYVTIPRVLRDTRFALARWSREELAAADEIATRVIAAVVRQEFGPITYPARYGADWAAICQDEVFERYEWPAEEVSR
jgi:hypothetical protein